MRKYIIIGALACSLVAPAAAEANYPSSSQISEAKWIARDYWQNERGFKTLQDWSGCWGVAIRYEPMYGGTLGSARLNGCTVKLNSRADWSNSWHRLCWTMIHEYGHLYGYRHTYKRGSVMYPYSQRFWYC